MITSIQTDLKTGREDRHMRRLLDEGLRRARRRGGPLLISTTRPLPDGDPLACFERSAGLARERLFWARPDEGYACVGVGAAWTLALEGPGRFAAAGRAWRDLCADALLDSQVGASERGPLLFGGFSFDPLRPTTPLWSDFPDGLLILPRHTITHSKGSSWLTTNMVVWPNAAIPPLPPALPPSLLAGEPPARAIGRARLERRDALPASAWKALVRTSIEQMRSSNIEKVVLARACHVQADRPLEPAQVLERLRAEYPGCFVFAVARGATCFLGASPERLVRLHQGEVQALCLAGTTPRGTTPAEDQALGAALLASAKDRSEHAIVVRGLLDALADLCGQINAPDQPALMKVRNVQHLYTPVSGQIKPGQTVLDLVERLHPTPAMGGLPRDAAMALIRARERLDRGWYAAPIGWMDAYGDGEFAVAIRSGLLRGSSATLFAGCGIVPASDPEREYDETCMKLRPMLSALEG